MRSVCVFSVYEDVSLCVFTLRLSIHTYIRTSPHLHTAICKIIIKNKKQTKQHNSHLSPVWLLARAHWKPSTNYSHWAHILYIYIYILHTMPIVLAAVPVPSYVHVVHMCALCCVLCVIHVQCRLFVVRGTRPYEHTTKDHHLCTNI